MPTLNYGDIRCDEKAGLKTGGCTLPSSVLANILRGQCACGSNPLAGVAADVRNPVPLAFFDPDGYRTSRPSDCTKGLVAGNVRFCRPSK